MQTLRSRGIACELTYTTPHFPRDITLSRLQSLHTNKMAGVLALPKPRITCSMLSQHINKPVCFVGRVEKVHPSGKSFTISDGEGAAATVELDDPLEEELSGVVEVIGMVSNKGVIMATTYNPLREDKGIPFDLELYTEALKVIHDFPQYYPFQVAESG